MSSNYNWQKVNLRKCKNFRFSNANHHYHRNSSLLRSTSYQQSTQVPLNYNNNNRYIQHESNLQPTYSRHYAQAPPTHTTDYEDSFDNHVSREEGIYRTLGTKDRLPNSSGSTDEGSSKLKKRWKAPTHISVSTNSTSAPSFKSSTTISTNENTTPTINSPNPTNLQVLNSQQNLIHFYDKQVQHQQQSIESLESQNQQQAEEISYLREKIHHLEIELNQHQHLTSKKIASTY